MNQRILYYVAAALFAVAAVLTSLREGGVSLKSILGIGMCAIMLWLGMRVGRHRSGE